MKEHVGFLLMLGAYCMGVTLGVGSPIEMQPLVACVFMIGATIFIGLAFYFNSKEPKE
jgi:FtsH-binding integral membrane protein